MNKSLDELLERRIALYRRAGSTYGTGSIDVEE
jgi:hypothetical protein